MLKHANATGASKLSRWFGNLPPGIAELAQSKREERIQENNISQLKAQIVSDLQKAEEYEVQGMLWLADQHRLHAADGVAALVREGGL